MTLAVERANCIDTLGLKRANKHRQTFIYIKAVEATVIVLTLALR